MFLVAEMLNSNTVTCESAWVHTKTRKTLFGEECCHASKEMIGNEDAGKALLTEAGTLQFVNKQ